MTSWEVWRLGPALRWYVTGVVAIAVVAAGAVVEWTSWRARDLVVFAALACFGALAIELTRHVTEPAGLIKTVHGIWQIPMALLLPPVYCLAAPAITFTLIQVRVHRTIAHRQVFSAAASGLSLAAASALFHTVTVPASRPPLWLLAAAVTALVWLVANKALVMTAGWLSDRTVNVRDRVFGRESLINDMCELATGVLLAAALAGAGTLLLLLPALPLVTVLQRSFRHAQLASAARLDAGTGLLNAAAWRAEAAVQLAQAQRTGAAVAVALADLDHCRAVNDTYGWQAGDAVLGAVAGTLRVGLRPYDLLGRVGADEFAILLPGTTAGEALLVADRLRRTLAAQTTPIGPGHQPVHVTMSVGIAAAADPGSRDLTDLLWAAEEALRQAKTAGRDRVCLSTDNAGAGEPGPGGQEGEGRASGREDIAAARRELGALLATLRTQAKLTQAELARRAGYSRSAIANAESGQAMSASFWASVDRAVGADGRLAGGHARIEALVVAARRQADRQAWMERSEAAGDVAGAMPEAGDRAVQDSACPGCGLPLMVTTQVIATVIPQITEADLGSAVPDPFRERPGG